jgi:glycosyltransferase involved in cell wall biosynthesis
MLQNKKIVIVMPAYNIEKTLELTVSGVPKNVVDEILVINDASQDNTVAIAKKLNVVLITHQKNIGYGGAQKTGYTEALARAADIIVMLHGDFQYDPTLVPLIIAPLVSGTADACFGSRLHSKSSNAKGMPWWRFVANIALSRFEEIVFHLGLSEYHTGYRAYTSEVLRSIPFHLNSDNYVFDSEIIAQIASGGFRVAEIPIPIRYEKDSQSPNFLKSTQYGLMTLIVVVKYLLHRLHIKTCAQFVIARRGSAV